MAQILVRNLEDDVKDKLEQRAREHRRSMEEEVREILRRAVLRENSSDLRMGSRLAARFSAIGLDDEIPELRGQPARPADLER